MAAQANGVHSRSPLKLRVVLPHFDGVHAQCIVSAKNLRFKPGCLRTLRIANGTITERKEKIENHRMTYAMYYPSILRSVLDPSEGVMRYYIPIFITKIKEKKTYYRIVVA